MEPLVVDSSDLSATRKQARDLIRARKMEGNTIAVDVTPGRTIPKLALYEACVQAKPDHVFYLSVADYDYRPLPYVRIPFRLQESKTLVPEAVQG